MVVPIENSFVRLNEIALPNAKSFADQYVPVPSWLSKSVISFVTRLVSRVSQPSRPDVVGSSTLEEITSYSPLILIKSCFWTSFPLMLKIVSLFIVS